jgi:hypothetical protein
MEKRKQAGCLSSGLKTLDISASYEGEVWLGENPTEVRPVESTRFTYCDRLGQSGRSKLFRYLFVKSFASLLPLHGRGFATNLYGSAFKR